MTLTSKLTHGNNPHNNESVYSDFKLFQHLDKVAEWQEKGYASAPVIIDLDLTDHCNHHCPACIYKFTNTEKIYIPTEKAREILTDAAQMGSKAVTFAGGGDPTMHPDFEKLILHSKEAGLEAALFSNCYEMNDSLIETIVRECTWMRVSLDADGPEIYKKTHAMGEEEFNQAIGNVRKITSRARETGSDLRVGICYLMGPHTVKGIYTGAKLAKDLGAQEIRFRPFFNFEDRREGTAITRLMDIQVKKGRDRNEQVKEIREQLARAEELRDDGFSVSYPDYRVAALEGKGPRGFSTCYYPQFSASITADMKLYPCCPLKSIPEYEIGDLSNASFREVWNSDKRRKVHEMVDFKSCPNPCQFHNHALLLSGIKQAEKSEHKNFL